MGYEPGIFREILVTSAKEVYLEIPLKESVNELNEVVIRARTNKEEAMNKMATTGARMLSVEEASRITLRILPHWVEGYFHLLVRRYWVIPIFLPELFRQNMEMRYLVCLI